MNKNYKFSERDIGEWNKFNLISADNRNGGPCKTEKKKKYAT
jgi:hypothetical protein